LEVRAMEEAIAGEAARPPEKISAATPLVDQRVSTKEERRRWQRRVMRRTGKGWSPPTRPSTSKTATKVGDVHGYHRIRTDEA
jgi:hypothetical protein